MSGRIAHLAAAAVVSLLLATAIRTLCAETAYERGLDLASGANANPSADVPGRLEQYEEAMRRDPGQPLYALRSAQIRLQRAAKLDGTARNADLTTAAELLDRAIGEFALDWSAHAALAQTARLKGDAARAVRESSLAIRLGPRAPGSLRPAITAGLWAFKQTRDPAALRLALQGGLGFVEMGEPIGDRGAGATLRTGLAEMGDLQLADLLDATAGDPALARLAADLIRPSRPLAADALVEFGTAPPPGR